MKYETQKLALLYFWGAMILFLAQVTFGVLAGSIYVLSESAFGDSAVSTFCG